MESSSDDNDDDDDAPEPTTTHEGDVDSRGRPHGFGRATYADGSTYEGEFRHGVRDGFGTLTLPASDDDGSAEDERSDEEEEEDNDRVPARYVGGWRDDVPHGDGKQISSDGCALEATFSLGTPTGEIVSTYADGVTVRYVGELGEDGEYGGVGTSREADVGGCVTAVWSRGELAEGLAAWQERDGDVDAVVAWTRASFGATRTRGRNSDLAPERAVIVRLDDARAADPRRFVRELRGASKSAPVRDALPDGVTLVLDERRPSLTSIDIERYFERKRVCVRSKRVYAVRDVRAGECVAYFSGRERALGDVSELDAETLAEACVMVREDDRVDIDVVASHDEESMSYAKAHGVRALELDDALAANWTRRDTKVETNCERFRVDNHPLLGEAMCLRATRDIRAGEECTVAPDYFFGWCLDPRSEAGYYESMRCHPPRVVFERENDVDALGRVRVRAHGRWRAMYLDAVEQGLSYVSARTDAPVPDALGFQYIRCMARVAVRRVGDARRRRRATFANARDIVAVGLGTGALPLYLANEPTLRDARVIAVERSQAVIDACRDARVPLRLLAADDEDDEDDENDGLFRPIRVVREDAFDFVANRASESTLLVLLDAYDGRGDVPAHVASDEFLRMVGKSLASGGHVVCNCWNGPPGSREAVNLETFERMLARRVGVVERERVVGQEYNVVVVAAKK